jgi:hypothetical protein
MGGAHVRRAHITETGTDMNIKETTGRRPRSIGRRISAVMVATSLGLTGLAAVELSTVSPASAAGCYIPPDADPGVVATIYAVSRDRGVSDRVMLAVFETAWVESHVNNLPCGDSDSLGVFQQRPSQHWGTPAQVTDPVYATNAFLDRAIRLDRSSGPEVSAGTIAWTVQNPAESRRWWYDASEGMARALIAEAGGTLRPSSTKGDVNGDGHADLIMVDRNAGATVVHVADGTDLSHTLTDAVTPWGPTAGDEWDYTAGDINGDGHADLIMIDRNAGATVVHVADGTDLSRTLTDAVTPWGPTAGDQWDFTAGDVNGDGHADLIMIDRNAGATVVHVADGTDLSRTLTDAVTPWGPTAGDQWDFAS